MDATITVAVPEGADFKVRVMIERHSPETGTQLHDKFYVLPGEAREISHTSNERVTCWQIGLDVEV